MVVAQTHSGSGDPPVAVWAPPIESFDDLLVRYQDEIYRYAMRLTRNQPDADDLFQESLLKAYNAFGRLGRDANHRAWLYKIVTNTFISDRRKAQRERTLGDGAIGDVPAKTLDQTARIDAKDLLEEVRDYVDSLPEKQRIALILRKYHEFDYSAIATTLNCSEDAARANVYEAVRKLRHAFGSRVEA